MDKQGFIGVFKVKINPKILLFSIRVEKNYVVLFKN